MSGGTRDQNELLSEVEDLRRENERLRAQVTQAEESQETLRAIREGEVDALLVSGPQGDRIYTLQSAEQPYRILIQQMREGAVTLVADGTIYYANHAFAGMLGRPLEQVMGSALREHVVEADRPFYDALFEQSLAGSSRGEVSLRAENGTLLPAYLSFSLLTVNHIKSICVAITDLTEQKRSEQILASERFARAIVNQAGDGIVVCDGQGQLTFANATARLLAGLDPFGATPDLIPDLWGEALDQDGRPVLAEDLPLFKALREGEVITGRELHLVRQNSGHYHLLVSASPLREADGSIMGAVMTFSDITDRKQAEEAMRESERNYRIVAEHTYDWEFWLSPNGKFLYNSPSCLNLTGYSLEEFKADPELLKRIIHPEDRAIYEEHLGSGEVCATEEVEFRIIRRDGAVRWVAHVCQPVHDEEGRFLGVRGSNRDITERRRAEEGLGASSLPDRGGYRPAPAGLLEPAQKLSEVHTARRLRGHTLSAQH